MSRLCAVIGSPVRHSLSPAMHRAAFRAAGLDWSFAAFEVVAGGAAAAIDAMAPLGITGYAVTMPHKADAARAVDEVDAAAAALDSVNTVVVRDDGSTFGTSTDGSGFVGSLIAAGFRLAGSRVVVLGAGGAARAIVDALGRSDVADIAIVNRSPDGARAAQLLAAQARLGSIDDVRPADLLVNATSVGMGADASPIDASSLHAGLTVADIVYHPLDTVLLRTARAAGASTIDGLGMLTHQAVLQHEIWTGHSPAAAVLRAAAEAELLGRSR